MLKTPRTAAHEPYDPKSVSSNISSMTIRSSIHYVMLETTQRLLWNTLCRCPSQRLFFRSLKWYAFVQLWYSASTLYTLKYTTTLKERLHFKPFLQNEVCQSITLNMGLDLVCLNLRWLTTIMSLDDAWKFFCWKHQPLWDGPKSVGLKYSGGLNPWRPPLAVYIMTE